MLTSVPSQDNLGMSQNWCQHNLFRSRWVTLYLNRILKAWHVGVTVSVRQWTQVNAPYHGSGLSVFIPYTLGVIKCNRKPTPIQGGPSGHAKVFVDIKVTVPFQYGSLQLPNHRQQKLFHDHLDLGHPVLTLLETTDSDGFSSQSSQWIPRWATRGRRCSWRRRTSCKSPQRRDVSRVA